MMISGDDDIKEFLSFICKRDLEILSYFFWTNFKSTCLNLDVIGGGGGRPSI